VVWNLAGSSIEPSESTRLVLETDPPVKVDGWGPAGELRVWLRAEDGWWGLVAGRDRGAVDARQGSP
jgi:hypothetical protein